MQRKGSGYLNIPGLGMNKKLQNIEKLHGDLIIYNKFNHITIVSGLQQGKPALKKLTYRHSEKIMV
jgi:hypothetical protein